MSQTLYKHTRCAPNEMAALTALNDVWDELALQSFKMLKLLQLIEQWRRGLRWQDHIGLQPQCVCNSVNYSQSETCM